MIQHPDQFVVFSKTLSSHKRLPKVICAFNDKVDAKAFSCRSHKYGEAMKAEEFLTDQANACVNHEISAMDAIAHLELALVARKYFIEKYENFSEIKRNQRAAQSIAR